MKKLIFFVLVVLICTSLISFHKLKYNGIDVSHHNGVINWNKVAMDKNIKFVYIKATEGKSYKDPMYKFNLSQAKKHGFLVGSYHFFREAYTPQQQFENIKSTINKDDQDLIPVIDIEHCKSSKAVENFKKLSELIEEYYGVKPMVYIKYSDYIKYFYNELNDYKVWAEWPIKTPCLFKSYEIIQCAQHGIIEGTNVDTDLNFCKDLNCIKYARN